VFSRKVLKLDDEQQIQAEDAYRSCLRRGSGEEDEAKRQKRIIRQIDQEED